MEVLDFADELSVESAVLESVLYQKQYLDGLGFGEVYRVTGAKEPD